MPETGRPAVLDALSLGGGSSWPLSLLLLNTPEKLWDLVGISEEEYVQRVADAGFLAEYEAILDVVQEGLALEETQPKRAAELFFEAYKMVEATGAVAGARDHPLIRTRGVLAQPLGRSLEKRNYLVLKSPERMMSVAALPDIDEVDARSEADDECFAELRAVLERHNALGRFGITLLHQHFDIADDELLVEEVDVESRTLTICPVPRAEITNARVKETNWRLDSDVAVSACTPYQFCYVDNKNDHHPRSGHK